MHLTAFSFDSDFIGRLSRLTLLPSIHYGVDQFSILLLYFLNVHLKFDLFILVLFILFSIPDKFKFVFTVSLNCKRKK